MIGTRDSGLVPEDRPGISVIIPAYNAERFLDATLASVTEQTFEAIEIIVVDDGSADGTPAIIAQWRERDARIRNVRTENGGVARARNVGLSLARAEFVAFLDSDDIWHPDKLRLQHDRLNSASADWAACYALYRSIDVDGRIVRDTPVLACSGYIYARHLLCHFVGNGSSLLVRRQAALEVGGFDPSYAAEGIGGCEDLDFELRLAARYRITSVPLFLIGYRRYDGNMSSDAHRMVRGMASTIERNLQSGPAVPSTIRRGAIVAVLEYALTAYLLAHDYRRASQTLLRLLFSNPEIALRILKRLPRFAGKKLSRLYREPVEAQPEAGPLFEELEPEFGTEAFPRAFLARRTRTAQVVDEALWRRLSQELTRSVPASTAS